MVELLTSELRSTVACRRCKPAVLCRRMTGIPLGTCVSTEHDQGAGEVTENDRWDVEISKNRVDEANLFYFRPDNICRAKERDSMRKWCIAELHIPR